MSDPIPRIRIELRPSRIHADGVGVFAVREIRKGQKVAEGLSEEDFQQLVSWDFFDRCDEAVRQKVIAFCVGTPDGFIPPPGFDFNKLSIEWYLNHSCDGNCGFDHGGDFVAIRNIYEGEEISYDYALAESNPRFFMRCTCGSKSCRHVITGNDWKDETFIEKHWDHMHPHLRRLISVPA
jgi:SET domain-containing protein